MRKITALLPFVCVAALIWGCGSLRRKPGSGKYSDHKINVGGRERGYVRYTPAGDEPAALLMLLHGGGGKASGMIRLAQDMPPLADRHRLLLVYPEGVGGHWNDGRGDISEAAREAVDDIAFLRAVAGAEGYPHRLPKVYAAGMSNGGMMAQRIACDMPDVVAAVITVAANLPEELAAKCQPERPVAVMFIAGMEDPIVPYAGGAIKVLRKDRGRVLSIEDSLAFWSRRWGCSARADQPFTASGFARDYACPKGALRLIAVKDGGHAWPGGTPYLPGFFIGKTSNEFSASEKIIEFTAGGR